MEELVIRILRYRRAPLSLLYGSPLPPPGKLVAFLVMLLYFSGGVLTPAAAFTGTSLIDRLNDHGVKFSVVRCEVDSSL